MLAPASTGLRSSGLTGVSLAAAGEAVGYGRNKACASTRRCVEAAEERRALGTSGAVFCARQEARGRRR